MANQIIRPDDLPPRANPVASEVVPSDNGSIVAGVTWTDGVNAGRPLASQNEAEAGVQATKAMTPLTTKQAIDAQVPVIVGGAIAGLGLGTAAQADVGDFATAAQGGLADTAVQPGDLATVATSGSYLDLTDKPTLSDETSAESRAWAIANLHPVSAPSFIRTAGYSAPGDLGGALYKYVVVEPIHAGKFSITLDDGVTVVWYELCRDNLGGVNVKAFGAKCDYVFGVGGTDDTQAVLDAIAYLLAPNDNFDGGWLLFPTGGCSVSSIDLTGMSNIRFLGAGRETTWIVGNLSTGGDFVVGSDGYVQGGTSIQTRQIVFMGLSVTASTAAAYTDCVRMHAAVEWDFANFTIGGNEFTRAALKFEYAYTHTLTSGSISNTHEISSERTYAVLIGSGQGADNCNNITFNTIRTINKAPDRVGKVGTLIGFGISGININFIGVDASYTDVGYECQASRGVQFIGSYAEYVSVGIDQRSGGGFTNGLSVYGFYASIIANGIAIRTSTTGHQSRDVTIHNLIVSASGSGAVGIDFGTGTYGVNHGYVNSTGVALAALTTGAPAKGGGIGLQHLSSEVRIATDGVVELPGVPSGVSAVQKVLKFGADGAGLWIGGIGTPESLITAAVGSLFMSTTGGGAYYKATGSGNTGWVKMN